jgi:outer membrane protein assembly factor BamB
MKPTHFFVAATLAAQLVQATHDASASSDAVTYQIDVGHSGQGSLQGFKGKLKLRWVQNLGNAISYPLITSSMVYVTVAGDGNSGNKLYALDINTGAIVWQQTIGGTYRWTGAAYDNGQVFTVNYDGVASAFAADTGALDWSEQLPDQYAFSAPPTAQNGSLFIGGSGFGGTLYSIDEVNGAAQWTATVQNGDNSSPAIGKDGLFVTYPCQYYGFAAANGSRKWYHNGGCEGGGGSTPVYFDNRLYVRDDTDSILNAKTGAEIGTFGSQYAPAFFSLKKHDYGVGLFGVLNCFDATTGLTRWTFTGDGSLSTASLVVGSYVIEGSSQGNLYVLNESSGKEIFSINVGASIPSPQEGQVTFGPLTGLGAANGILVVPAGSQISAYEPS